MLMLQPPAREAVGARTPDARQRVIGSLSSGLLLPNESCSTAGASGISRLEDACESLHAGGPIAPWYSVQLFAGVFDQPRVLY